MIRRLIRILAAICAGLLVTATTASIPAPSGGAFVIRNVRIFDGEKVIDANSLAVADGKIVAVGNEVAAPPNSQLIDGRGDTILPGLIDAHVHAWGREVLEMGLMMGVTTELDMYMNWETAQKWKAEEAKGAFDIADFRTAGTAIAVAGGHGTEPTLPPMIPIRGPEQAQAFVDERIAHGADYIKVFYDNGPRFAAMSKETLAAIVKAAHARHRMVIVHGGGTSLQGFLDVVDSGADGLAHLPIVNLPEPAVRDALKTHHIFAITTLGYTDFFLTPGHTWSRLPDDPEIGPYLGPLWRRVLEHPRWQASEQISYADSEAALRVFHDSGMSLLAGTDSSNSTPAGALLHAELELMVAAGLTPMETLADATSVPAKIFALNDRGRIAPGLRADLLLVHGDPTKDIRVTRDIVAIWKQGVRVDRESYRDQIAQKNVAWKFGAGWEPDTDAIFNGSSKVRLQTIDRGPDHAPSTRMLDCDVQPGIKYPFAGAMYFPSVALQRPAPVDLSGGKDITFWSRADGKTYAVAMFTQTGKWTPVLRPFIAGKEWEKHTMRFSEFHTDGHDITVVSIVATQPGKFRFEISGVHIGAYRWLGVQLREESKVVKFSEIDKNAPAAKAGIRVGDSIAAFNGKPVTSYQEVLRFLGETHIHDKVPIDIVRDGKHRTVTVEVGEGPQ